MPDDRPNSAPDELPADARDDRSAAAIIDGEAQAVEPAAGGLAGGLDGDVAAAAAVSMAMVNGPLPGTPGPLAPGDALAASAATEDRG